MSDDKAVAWAVALDGVIEKHRAPYYVEDTARGVVHDLMATRDDNDGGVYTAVPLYSAPREATTGGGDGALPEYVVRLLDALRGAGGAALAPRVYGLLLDDLPAAIRRYGDERALLDGSRGEGGKERAFYEAALERARVWKVLRGARGEEYEAAIRAYDDTVAKSDAAYDELDKSRSPRAGERGGGE